MFSEELEFFIDNQEALVADHQGKFLVIKGKRVVAVHDSALDAWLASKEEHEAGSFMIQPCQPGPDAYTVTIASSVIEGF